MIVQFSRLTPLCFNQDQKHLWKSPKTVSENQKPAFAVVKMVSALGLTVFPNYLKFYSPAVNVNRPNVFRSAGCSERPLKVRLHSDSTRANPASPLASFHRPAVRQAAPADFLPHGQKSASVPSTKPIQKGKSA